MDNRSQWRWMIDDAVSPRIEDDLRQVKLTDKRTTNRKVKTITANLGGDNNNNILKRPQYFFTEGKNISTLHNINNDESNRPKYGQLNPHITNLMHGACWFSITTAVNNRNCISGSCRTLNLVLEASF